jgi:hypothetical protein
MIADLLRDLALDYINDNGTRIDLCSTEPTTRTEAITTYTLGNKTGITYAAIADGDTSGRKLMTNAITGGSITGTGNASYWAITDGTDLLATGTITGSPVAVTSGDTWSAAAFKVWEIRD